MSIVVFVHPAWLGGWSWRKLVPFLAGAGHEVHTPTLTGLGERAHLASHDVDLGTHLADVVNTLVYRDLTDVVLVGNSSAGMVITGVAEEVPERIAELVYLDAFVPSDGQCLRDMILPERRAGMESLVGSEGDGWLLPRFAPPPWEQFLPQAWEVTDPDDLSWMLERLRPTPIGHFAKPVSVTNPQARALPRSYVRFTRWPHPGFDRWAQAAETAPGWRLRRLDAAHLAYITSPAELSEVLLELLAPAAAAPSPA
jgi:pimeloyl-ACP methyl ester carboxylesterase